jgi:hypothetical protein
MGLEKSIASGQERRKSYKGSKLYDRSCRNHGGCPYCESNRLHKHKRREPIIFPEEYDRKE